MICLPDAGEVAFEHLPVAYEADRFTVALHLVGDIIAETGPILSI